MSTAALHFRIFVSLLSLKLAFTCLDGKLHLLQEISTTRQFGWNKICSEDLSDLKNS